MTSPYDDISVKKPLDSRRRYTRRKSDGERDKNPKK